MMAFALTLSPIPYPSSQFQIRILTRFNQLQILVLKHHRFASVDNTSISHNLVKCQFSTHDVNVSRLSGTINYILCQDYLSGTINS